MLDKKTFEAIGSTFKDLILFHLESFEENIFDDKTIVIGRVFGQILPLCTQMEGGKTFLLPP